MSPKLLFFLMAIAGFCCARTTTSQLLDTDFVSKDLSGVSAISPSNKETVNTKNPQFLWTKRNGAISYTIEISAKSDMASPVLSKKVFDATYTLANADLQGITAMDEASYYWRISVQYSDQLVSSSVFVFNVLGTTSQIIIYVDANSTATEQVGNKSFPLKSIAGGLLAADARRNSVATVAAEVYVAQGNYNEEVSLRPGISLRGGYEATNWTRSISAYRSKIQGPDLFGVKGSSLISTTHRATTILDGFTITPGSSTGSGIAVHLYSSSPTVINNTIYASAASGSQGLKIYDVSSPIVYNNVISGPASGTGNGSAVEVSVNATPLIMNNTINGGNSTGGVSGIYMCNAAQPTLRNNIIFVGATSGSRKCIEECGTITPIAVENNYLFDCPTAYYVDSGGSTITSGNLGTAINGVGTLAAQGNIADTATAATVFVDHDGPDNNIGTNDDNDWRLGTGSICNLRGGGLNLSGFLTLDKDFVSRTTGNPACGAPTNTGAQGWSMGAFEKG